MKGVISHKSVIEFESKTRNDLTEFMFTNTCIISSESSVFILVIVVKCRDNQNQCEMNRLAQRSNYV